mmetsp:Transcript_55194/g.66455  ORF Transcript_55194/g.66455 Transcript_55194/m.66455 type:complete len:679 (+) Transcript_55194:90-2126(+)
MYTRLLSIILLSVCHTAVVVLGEVCNETCEEEFARCVHVMNCEHCLTELQESDSRLMERGDCTVGCDLTTTMYDACPEENNPISPVSSPTPPNSPVLPTAPVSNPVSDVEDRPTEPTLCNESNMGDCDCGTGNIQTYVFWPGEYQRCIHTYIPTSHNGDSPLPVLVEVGAYGQGKLSQFAPSVAAAEYYGFALIGLGSTGPSDGAGGFGLQFPAGGVVNGNNPTPCSADDSRDHSYIEGAFNFIAEREEMSESRVYLQGFSQNSMYAAYISVCFADRVVGLWQGGSGLAKTYHTPITPGFQGQCSTSSYSAHGSNCCEEEFCEECAYWPVYPRTCEHTLVDCIASYTDDGIACGTDWYMYEAMVAEGNDARLLSFTPTSENGGHSDPMNTYAWVVGCLGIVESCSDACEAVFGECVADSQGTGSTITSFEACEADIADGILMECEIGCAPTMEMLKLSESPVVTLSEGKFGTQTDLEAHVGSAPRPECDAPFGSFDDPSVNHNKCQPDGGVGPGPEVTGSCGSSPVTEPVSSPITAPVTAPITTPVTAPVSAPNNGGSPCEESCEIEFPMCVGATNCDNCLEELSKEGSILVQEGGCTVGCSPTPAMNNLCEDDVTGTPDPSMSPVTNPPVATPVAPVTAPASAPTGEPPICRKWCAKSTWDWDMKCNWVNCDCPECL